jgi:hypothetical protein
LLPDLVFTLVIPRPFDRLWINFDRGIQILQSEKDSTMKGMKISKGTENILLSTEQ